MIFIDKTTTSTNGIKSINKIQYKCLFGCTFSTLKSTFVVLKRDFMKFEYV